MKITKDKKGLSTLGTLGTIVLVIALVMVVMLKFFPGIAKAGETSSRLFDAGDCDLDGAVNFPVDQCPCISTGGLEGELRGCPLGVSKEEANLDKLTCGWFLTSESSCGGLSASECYQKEGNVFYSNCDGDKEKKCVKRVGGKVKTRCDQVSETSVGVSAKKGLAGNWDLVASSLKIMDRDKDDKVVQEGIAFDLENSRNVQEVQIDLTLENAGTENIPRDFVVTVEICNENREEDSCEKKESISAGPLRSKEKMIYVFDTVKIGEKDLCSGGSEARCNIRVRVDSNNDLAELDENNNQLWFFVTLKNKQSEEIDWGTFKSVEIFADSGENPEFRSKIRRTCSGFLGTDECPYQEGECSLAIKNELLPSGCLVYAVEDDLGSNNCGLAGIKAGFVLSNLDYAKMYSEIATPFEGDDDAGDLFSYNWQSNQGALVCGSDKLWYGCDLERAGKVLLVGGKRFRCEQDRSWKLLD